MRRALIAMAVVCAATVALALPYGPLFPWSPWKPGYQSKALVHATVFWPKGQPVPPSFLEADTILEEATRFHGLGITRRVTIVQCADWDDFFRFLPTLRSKGIGGATLQTGNVVYITPKVAEMKFSTAEFLGHEISHAILHQNTPLWKTFEQQRHSWLYEGVPVWFGRQTSYYSHAQLVESARSMDLEPLFRAGATGMPNMRLAYTAWAAFLESLDRTHGHEKLIQLLRAFGESPSRIEESFGAIYGQRLPDAVRAFQATLVN